MAEQIKSWRSGVLRVLLISAIAVAVWETGGLIAPADAQSGASLPNAAAQRDLLIKQAQQQNQQLQQINSKLDELTEHLKNGKLEVVVSEVRHGGR